MELKVCVKRKIWGCRWTEMCSELVWVESKSVQNEKCHFAGTQLNVCFCCAELLRATLRITFKPLAHLRLAFLQPVPWILQSVLLCSAVAFMKLCWIASVWPEPRLRMLRVHIVLVSVHSSSHLFVPFLTTQCLRNTLRKVLSFPFLTDLLTKEKPRFDRPGDQKSVWSAAAV